MLKHIFDSAQTQAMLSEIVSCTFSSLVFQVFEVRIFCLPFDQGTLKKKRILMVLNIFHRLISQQCHVVIHNHFFPATVTQCTVHSRIGVINLIRNTAKVYPLIWQCHAATSFFVGLLCEHHSCSVNFYHNIILLFRFFFIRLAVVLFSIFSHLNHILKNDSLAGIGNG